MVVIDREAIFSKLRTRTDRAYATLSSEHRLELFGLYTVERTHLGFAMCTSNALGILLTLSSSVLISTSSVFGICRLRALLCKLLSSGACHGLRVGFERCVLCLRTRGDLRWILVRHQAALIRGPRQNIARIVSMLGSPVNAPWSALPRPVPVLEPPDAEVYFTAWSRVRSSVTFQAS